MKSKIKRSSNRLRLYIFKSNKHIYAQIIDDKKHKILCSSSSISKDLKLHFKSNLNCKTAYIVGQNIASKAIHMGINKVLLDCGNRIYHGQIKSLADGARREGIDF